MANLWASTALALMLAITASEAGLILPEPFLEGGTLNVFKKGNLETATIRLEKSHSSAPPHPLFLVSPKETGAYPVLFFIHGTMLPNYFYSDVFEHIASHGFVVIAPQLYLSMPFPYQSTEIERAVSVANWLASMLDSVLPEGVEGDLSRFAVSGHSRGAKTAFALALGKHYAPLTVKISAVIGVDPVAGTNKNSRTKPHILTYVPNSFNLSIPVTVIGTGYGNRSRIPFGPSCAPNEVNHDEFFNECRKDCTHFVLSEYGHMDMLNAGIMFDLPYGPMARMMCVNGKGDGGPMRSSLGGLMVAFLNAYLLDEAATFATILADPSVAPTKLYPVQAKYKVNYQLAKKYAEV